MDIRQNPIAPNATPLAPQQQALAPPSAGPAAAAPVPPSLPQPVPSVVAISETSNRESSERSEYWIIPSPRRNQQAVNGEPGKRVSSA